MDSLSDVSFLNSLFERFYPIGSCENGGVTRLGYGPEENKMHNMLKDISKGLGFKVETDSAGNSFVGIGDAKYEKYHLIGSHLDSVPSGGRYDGVCGVLSGLLVLNWIKKYNLKIPVKVVAFRCEESSAFGRATIGSSLSTGSIKDSELAKLKNVNGESLLDVFEKYGYSPEPYKMQNVIDYIELHIEQGRVLWEKGMDIGIVTSIAAPRRYRLNILGRQDHSGATPMYMRKDALCAAAEVISLVEELGKKESVHSTVATVGIIKEKPNVMNVVPGFVELGIDIRGIDKDSINRVLDGLKKDTDNIMKRRGIDYEFQKISSSDPVTLDRSVIESLKRAAKKLNIDFVEMPSGAGHDAMEMANITKAGMIFIPCKEGISHNIHEKADLDKVIEGSKIILEYLKEESL